MRVDHADVIGTCYSCHNGSTATGKNTSHIQSSNNCDDCHTTTTWQGAVFDHSNLAAGTCSSCHNGSTATGKPGNHIQTSASCDSCHTANAWVPANFNHDNVSGSCSTCHNGSQATGKSSGHFQTSRQCDYCHSTTGWTPLTFRHNSAVYPGDHRANPTCVQCHKSNAEVVVWDTPTYEPDCAGCHANDYRQGAHNNRTVSDNRDCGRSGCHRASDRSFSK